MFGESECSADQRDHFYRATLVTLTVRRLALDMPHRADRPVTPLRVGVTLGTAVFLIALGMQQLAT
jgi:hypothetical protein